MSSPICVRISTAILAVLLASLADRGAITAAAADSPGHDTESAHDLSPEPPAMQEATPPDSSDHERILGSWRSTRYEKDGKVDPTASGAKYVFRKDQLLFHGFPLSYTLDPTQDPKHINGNLHGIYKLDGNVLTICFATTTPGARPTEFSTAKEDNRQLVVFKRLPLLDPNQPDADFDKTLRAAILQAITLVEQGKTREFLRQFMPPEQLESTGGRETEATIEHVSAQNAAILNSFRGILKITPKIDATGTKATFDLTRTHIEDGLGAPMVKFIKVGDRWYFRGE